MFALYLAWAYTPEAMLHALGVTYYPDKYWAAAGPVWMCAAGLYGAWAYEGVNRMAVRRIDAVELIEEEGGSIPRRLDRPDPPVSRGDKLSSLL
jgi:phosphatidylinositol glycan class P protein